METVPVREAADESMLGQRVQVQGWLYRRSETDEHIDLIIRDPTGFMVCRFTKSGISENLAVQAAGINERSSIVIEGVMNRDPDTTSGFRLEAVEMELVDEAEDIDVAGGQTDNFYRDINELWKYPDRYGALNRLGSKVFNRINGFFRKQEWYFTDPPIHVNEAYEGGLFVDDDRVSDPMPFLEALSYVLGRTYTVHEGRDDRMFSAAATWTDLPAMAELGQDLVSRVMIGVAKESHPEMDTLKRDYTAIREDVASFETLDHDGVLEMTGQDELGEQAFHAIGEDHEHPVIVLGREREPQDIALTGEDDAVETISIVAPDGHGRVFESFAFETEPGAIIDRLRDTGQDPDRHEWLMDLRRDGVVPHTGVRVFQRPFIRWLADLHHEEDGRNFYHTFSKL